MIQSTTDELGRGSGEEPTPPKYIMRISRLTVDKLGVKLYDKVSAVLAELIANAYDADAQRVTIHAPMGQLLASKAGGRPKDKGLEIRIEDDGIGMTPEEMQEFFLIVGAERRVDARRGPRSRRFGRAVMGRKGVGKLAPFGICKTMEIVSSGGERVQSENGEAGYRTSHITLNYYDIVEVDDEPDERYQPKVGPRDDTLSAKAGTTITLREFNFRKVSDIETLARQIAQRFGIESKDWRITLEDNDGSAGSRVVGAFDVPTMPNTRLDFGAEGKVSGPVGALADIQAGFEHDGAFYPVTGWMAYSKRPYRDELMAGVRIYCNKKIAAQTMVFNNRAGFTGEHSVRSYLVGELHADWLDKEDDLIQTDRRDILWSDELASEFQDWGQQMVRRIGTLSRDPMRKATLDIFLATGHVEDRIRDRFPKADDRPIRDRASELAKIFGKTMSRAEAEDEEAVGDLVNLSIQLAPHITLDAMMRKAGENANGPFDVLTSILQTAQVAELFSFGRIAGDRLKVIRSLETLKDVDKVDEDRFQRLIERAPWLVNPEWAPITENQPLSSVRKEFELYYERKTGVAIQLSDFRNQKKRPDFILSSQDGMAQIVEIKKPRHSLKNHEMDRIVSYHDLMKSFLEDNKNSSFGQFFHGFHITLVCDELGLSGSQRAAFDGYRQGGVLSHFSWANFLIKTRLVHQAFLAKAEQEHKDER